MQCDFNANRKSQMGYQIDWYLIDLLKMCLFNNRYKFCLFAIFYGLNSIFYYLELVFVGQIVAEYIISCLDNRY